MIKICESKESRSEELSETLLMLKRDFKKLAKCETLDDIENTKLEYFGYITTGIRFIMKRDNISVEDAIDKVVNNLYSEMERVKQKIEYFKDYESKYRSLMKDIISGLSDKYDIINITDTEILINPPKGSNHDDCVDFVDEVVSIIDGKYDFTGRGSSWTAWGIKSKSGVEFEAGWARDNKWFITVKFRDIVIGLL